MSERLNELYILTQKAQKMELVNEEIALEVYMEIFENYQPKISKTYDSAIRLLEKRHRFEEALSICNNAIELIEAQEISGTVERFQSIKERLERKILESGASTAPPKKKFKLRPSHVIILLAIVAIGILIFRFATPYDNLNVNLEGKEALDGGDKVFSETTDPGVKQYPITDDMIELAGKALKKNQDISDCDIIPQEGTLGIAVIVKPGTTDARGKELAVAYVRALSGAAAAAYTELEGPSKERLGTLYDYYELVISVGTGASEKELIAKGTKVKGAKDIYWRQ